MISSSTGTGKKSGVGSGKETLRLRSKGPATVQVVSENKEHHMTAMSKPVTSLFGGSISSGVNSPRVNLI